MGERLLCKQEVIGSIPFTSTIATARHSDDMETGIPVPPLRRRLRRISAAVLCHCEEVVFCCQSKAAEPVDRSGLRWIGRARFGDWRHRDAETIAPGLSLRMTVSQSSAEGHLVNALALRGDEGRSTLR